MKNFTYHKEFRTLIAQVLNALDGLVIKRLNEQDEETVTDQIGVSLVYAPKQRVIYDLVNKSQHIKLPVMALSMSNITYDAKRAFNKLEGWSVSQQENPNGGTYPQPTPVTLSLNLSILTRYQRDLDQVLSTIFAYFFPYIIVSYEHPDIKQEVRLKLLWNGSINLNYPNDITAGTSYRMAADTTFTLEGWIYRNFDNTNNIIHNIPTSFTAVSALYDSYETMHSMESPITTDYLTVSGRPFIYSVSPYIAHVGESGVNLSIKGNMFEYLSGIAVSGSPQNVFAPSSYQTFNPFISSHRLSSVYPAFSGVSAEYEVLDNTHLTITLPEIQNIGTFDIIGWGIAGEGKLTVDSLRYPLSSYQFPYVNGVETV